MFKFNVDVPVLDNPNAIPSESPQALFAKMSPEERKEEFKKWQKVGLIEPTNDGFWGEAIEATAGGFIDNVVGGIGRTITELSPSGEKSALEKWSEDVMSRHQNWNAYRDYKPSGSFTDLGALGRTIGQGLATTAPHAVLNAIPGVGTALSFGTMMAQTYGDRVREYRELMPDSDNSTVVTAALLSSAVEACIENMFGNEKAVRNLVNRTGTVNALNNRIKASVLDALTESTKRLGGRSIKSVLYSSAKNGAEEGVEEVLQDITKNLTAKLFGSEAPMDFSDTLQSGIAGFVSGGAMGGAGRFLFGKGGADISVKQADGSIKNIDPKTFAESAYGSGIITAEEAAKVGFPIDAKTKRNIDVAHFMSKKDDSYKNLTDEQKKANTERAVHMAGLFKDISGIDVVVGGLADQILDTQGNEASNETTKNVSPEEIDGMRAGNIIYLRGDGRDVARVLGHEFKHWIDQNHVDLSERFDNELPSFLNEEGKRALAAEIEKYKGDEQVGKQEFMCDMFGSVLTNGKWTKSFVNKLESKESGLGAKFLETAKRFIDSFIEYIKNKPEYKDHAEDLVSDYQKISNNIGEIIAEVAARRREASIADVEKVRAAKKAKVEERIADKKKKRLQEDSSSFQSELNSLGDDGVAQFRKFHASDVKAFEDANKRNDVDAAGVYVAALKEDLKRFRKSYKPSAQKTTPEQNKTGQSERTVTGTIALTPQEEIANVKEFRRRRQHDKQWKSTIDALDKFMNLIEKYAAFADADFVESNKGLINAFVQSIETEKPGILRQAMDKLAPRLIEFNRNAKAQIKENRAGFNEKEIELQRKAEEKAKYEEEFKRLEEEEKKNDEADTQALEEMYRQEEENKKQEKKQKKQKAKNEVPASNVNSETETKVAKEDLLSTEDKPSASPFSGIELKPFKNRYIREEADAARNKILNATTQDVFDAAIAEAVKNSRPGARDIYRKMTTEEKAQFANEVAAYTANEYDPQYWIDNNDVNEFGESPDASAEVKASAAELLEKKARATEDDGAQYDIEEMSRKKVREATRGGKINFSVVTSPDEIARITRELDNDERSGKGVFYAYRTMEMDDNGNLYPPKAKVVEGKTVPGVRVGDIIMNDVPTEEKFRGMLDNNQIVERTLKNGDRQFYFRLKDGKDDIYALYAPYLHSRLFPFNNQLDGSYKKRYVMVKVAIPRSAMNSNEYAPHSSRSLGVSTWNTSGSEMLGKVFGEDANKVVLSRYMKILEVMDAEKQADILAEGFKKNNVTLEAKKLPRELRDALIRRGVNVHIGDVVRRFDEKQALGNGKKDYSVSNLYTGSNNDYANKDADGNIVNPPSLVYIGDGEGAQAFGWGLYSTDNLGIAKDYAKRLSSGKSSVSFNGNDYTLDSWDKGWEPNIEEIESLDEYELEELAMYCVLKYGGIDNAIKKLNNSEIEKTEEVANWIDKNRDAIKFNNGNQNIYEQTWFKNREPGDESHLIQWDKPISKENFTRIISHADAEGISKTLLDNGDTGESIYRKLSSIIGSQKGASEFLARADIDGIKYPARFTKGGHGQYGWNYVSFRDDNINVDHKWKNDEKQYSISNLYTGSPHDYANKDEKGIIVNPPSLRGVGSGTGHSIFGYGLYASDSRDVANGYADQLGGKGVFKDPNYESRYVYQQTFFTNRKPGDESHLIKWEEKADKKMLAKVEKNLPAEARPGFDKYMSMYFPFEELKSEMTGADIYEAVKFGMKDSEKAASEFLFDKCGVDGVKYRSDSGAYNYVSFSDKNIRVDHKWKNDEKQYSISQKQDFASDEQVNPVPRGMQHYNERQEFIDNAKHEVHHDDAVATKAARLIVVSGGIENFVNDLIKEGSINGDVEQRAVRLIQANKDFFKLPDGTRRKLYELDEKAGNAWGQAGRQRRLDIGTPEGLQNAISILVDKDYLERKKNGDKGESLAEMIQRRFGFDPLNIPKEVLENKDKRDEFLREQSAKLKNWDSKAYEYWMNAILSSPTTHLANTIGNAANVLYELGPKRLAEAMVNVFVKSPDGATFGEYKQMLKHINWSNAIKAAVDSFKYEMHGFNGKFDEGQGPAISGKKGRYIRVPGRALRAADAFIKAFIQPVEASAMAYREGVSNGLSGTELQNYIEAQLANENSSANEFGRRRALEITFQEDPGAAVRWMINAKNDSAVLKYLFPFVKTPYNIMRQGIRKGPMGVFNSVYDIASVISGKKKIDSQMIEHFAEQVVFWGAAMTLLGLGGKGGDEPWITGTNTARYGTGEYDFKNKNIPPMSIRIGNNWFSYSRIEPLATSLSTYADGLEAFKKADRGDKVQSALKQMAFGTFRTLKEKSFLQTFEQLIELMEDPEHQGSRWTSNFVASWVPNAWRTFKNSMDDSIPDYRNRESGADWWKKFFVDTMSRAGFAHKTPKLDYFGREIPKDASESILGSLAWRLTLPIQVKSANMDKVDEMFWEYNRTNPDDVYYPSLPNPSGMIGGRKVTFTSHYNEFVERSGKLAYKMMQREVSSGRINTSNPKKEDINKAKQVFTDARKQVREEMYRKGKYDK